METRLTLRPGERGTKKLLERYGSRWVCVRYRYDEKRAMRCTTVELIVAQNPWVPRARSHKRPRSPDEMVHVRVTYDQTELRAKLKTIGAIWRPRHRLWELPWSAQRCLREPSSAIPPCWSSQDGKIIFKLRHNPLLQSELPP